MRVEDLRVATPAGPGYRILFSWDGLDDITSEFYPFGPRDPTTLADSAIVILLPLIQQVSVRQG